MDEKLYFFSLASILYYFPFECYADCESKTIYSYFCVLFLLCEAGGADFASYLFN